MSYVPIVPYKFVGAQMGQFPMSRLPENAGSSALSGVPVLITAGMCDESPAIDDANDLIAGFSSEPFHNLTTDNTPKTLTYGAVQNQPAAVIIPGGAPPSDGKIGLYLAQDNILFRGNLKVDQSLALTDLPKIGGLVKDGTSGQWYVDTSASFDTAAEGACITVKELIDEAGTLNGAVAFTVQRNRQQLTQ